MANLLAIAGGANPVDKPDWVLIDGEGHPLRSATTCSSRAIDTTATRNVFFNVSCRDY